jgi:hypothetical protein
MPGFSSSCRFAQSRITASTLLPAWRLLVALVLVCRGTYISFPYRDEIRAATQRKFENAKVFYLGSYNIATAMRKGGLKLWYLSSSKSSFGIIGTLFLGGYVARIHATSFSCSSWYFGFLSPWRFAWRRCWCGGMPSCSSGLGFFLFLSFYLVVSASFSCSNILGS